MTPPPFTSLTQVTAAAVRPRHSSCVKETFSMTYRAARRRGGAHRLPLCARFLAAPLAMSSSTTVEELMSARVRQVWSSAGGRGRRGTITRRRNSCFLQSNPELGSPVVCWRAPPVSCRFFFNLPFCFFYMADDVCQSPRRPNPAYYASKTAEAPRTPPPPQRK